MSFYQDSFCHETNDTFVPKVNDFQVIQDYFVKKAFPMALSKVKKEEGMSPTEVRRFLIDLLKLNENTGNKVSFLKIRVRLLIDKFSDNYFLSAVIAAIGESFLKQYPEIVYQDSSKATEVEKPAEPVREGPETIVEEFHFGHDETTDLTTECFNFEDEEDSALFREACQEIERRRALDIMIPSYHNAITISSLQVYLKWMMAELIPVDLLLFLTHSRYGHYLHVRELAFDALILLDGIYNEPILEYLVDIIDSDPEPYIRYHVAKGLNEYASLASTRSEDRASARLYGRWTDAKTLFGKWEGVKSRLWKILKYHFF